MRQKEIELGKYIGCLFLIFLSMICYYGAPTTSDYRTTFGDIIGLLVVIALIALFMAVTTSLKASALIFVFVFSIWGIANTIVNEARGYPIYPGDFANITTAAKVAGRYKVSVHPEFIIGITISIIAILFTIFIVKEIRLTNVKRRLFMAFICLSFLIMMAIACITGFTYRAIGFAHTQYEFRDIATVTPYIHFFSNAVTADIQTSPDYDPKNMEYTLDNYHTIQTVPDKMPDIIVIMNESFADIGADTDVSPLGYLQTLQDEDNVISGDLNVSVYGGLTAVTEFEFLTGISDLFYGKDIVPYTRLDHDTPSLARDLKALGYKAIAKHPYDGDGYNRKNAYRYLGFDEAKFLDDYEKTSLYDKDKLLNSSLVSDSEFYKWIEQDVPITEHEQPIFSMNVTIQNHSPYNTSTEEEYVAYPDNEDIHNYLNYLYLSDQALKEIIEHYKDSANPVMIVFFGDHQPYLKGMTYDDSSRMYKVPYTIWANFPIENRRVDTSANYLGNNVLKLAGLPISDFRQFLEELKGDFPIITSNNEDIKGESPIMLYNDLSYYQINSLTEAQ